MIYLLFFKRNKKQKYICAALLYDANNIFTVFLGVLFDNRRIKVIFIIAFILLNIECLILGGLFLGEAI